MGKGLDCTCSALARRRYLSRLSGPLLDRVDVQIEVLPVTRADRSGAPVPETSAVVAGRVAAARSAARRRLTGTPWTTNAEVPGSWLRAGSRATGIDDDLDRALDRSLLTLRGVDRVLRVAWTLADLAGQDRPTRDDVGQALLLRTRGQVGA